MEPVRFYFKPGNELLSSHSGLALVGTLIQRSKLAKRVNKVEITQCKNPIISHSEILISMIGLLTIGRSDFEKIEDFRDDPFFTKSLGLKRCPSSPILRQRLEMAEGEFSSIIKEESRKLVRDVSPSISPLLVGGIKMVPLDLDVSPFDNSKTKKEGVSRTYKGFNGYAPMFAYLGNEGYLVNLELREGKQNCQKGTPSFLKETLRYSRQITDKNLLVRLDGGNDSKDNLEILNASEKVFWIIKRNGRRENKLDWLELAKREGVVNKIRNGKTNYTGVTDRPLEGIDGIQKIVFDITESTIDDKGQYLLIPETEVDTYWTNLRVAPEGIISIYHDHGTSEQFHSEIKSDIGLERFPSGKFSCNELILDLTMFAYNILRLCGQESLREKNGTLGPRNSRKRKVMRRRLRTIIQDLMYVATRLISSGKKLYLSFGRNSPYEQIFANIYNRFKFAVDSG